MRFLEKRITELELRESADSSVECGCGIAKKDRLKLADDLWSEISSVINKWVKDGK